MFSTDSYLNFNLSKFFGWSILLGITLLLHRSIFDDIENREFIFIQDYTIILNLIIFNLFWSNHNDVPKYIFTIPIILIVLAFRSNDDSSVIYEVPCLIFYVFYLFTFVNKKRYFNESNGFFSKKKYMNLLLPSIRIFFQLSLRVLLIWLIYTYLFSIFFLDRDNL
jgi:hypothetical protein